MCVAVIFESFSISSPDQNLVCAYDIRLFLINNISNGHQQINLKSKKTGSSEKRAKGDTAATEGRCNAFLPPPPAGIARKEQDPASQKPIGSTSNNPFGDPFENANDFSDENKNPFQNAESLFANAAFEGKDPFDGQDPFKDDDAFFGDFQSG